MKYIVSIAVDGRIDIKVEADCFYDAKEKALNDFASASMEGLPNSSHLQTRIALF